MGQQIVLTTVAPIIPSVCNSDVNYSVWSSYVHNPPCSSIKICMGASPTPRGVISIFKI